MTDLTQQSEVPFELVSELIKRLEPLSAEGRAHVLRTVATWFNMPAPRVTLEKPIEDQKLNQTTDDRFAGREEISPKDFVFEKDPRTDVERMACLAYYLTHFRDMHSFKNEDITRLNTEAAHRKFSNASVSASNAMRDGFFVPAAKTGAKQLSAMGERFVQALPNRETAEAIRQRMTGRRNKRADNGANSDTPSDEGTE